MKLTINFAIVGCGMVSRLHLAAIREIDDARLVGVYDADGAAAQKVAAEQGVKVYPSYDALLADSDVDAVCICTPSYLHAEHARQALKAGRHVLVEKPLALTTEDCDSLIRLAEERGVQIGVVSQLRFSPAVRCVKQALTKGLLGRLTRADLYMKYYRTQEYYDTGAWRGTWDKDGGGALMNQGIHGVDLLLYLMGPVSSIYAQYGTLAREIEVEDTLSAVMTYQGGALGVIEASTADWPGTPRRIEINGEYGRIVLEEDRMVTFQVEGEDAYQLNEQAAGGAASHNNPGAVNPAGHCEQLKNFISAVRGDTALLVDARAGRAAVALVLAAYRSQKQGKPVAVNTPWQENCEQYVENS